MSDNVAYHQQISYCGKPQCRKCREGVGHGPYWYAYRTENGRTTRTYIGKHLPADLQKTSELTPSDHTLGTLRIRVLGQFLLERKDGQDWQPIEDAAWQHQRVRSLLACLLSSPGRKLGREQIMDALWPDADIETATNRLDRSVYSLRQILEPTLSRPATSHLLRVERESLVLADQTELWVDADAFENLLTQTHAADDPAEREKLLEEAASLYGGGFLPEERFSDWSITRREGLQRSWMGLLLELADLRIARGALANAIDPLDRLLAADSTNEAAVQRLIISLAQLDRRGEALRAYQRFAAALQHEYNIAPLPETRSLYEAVLQGEALVTTTLPLYSQSLKIPGERDSSRAPKQMYKVQIGRTHQTPLIGREKELETMRHILLTTEQESRTAIASRKKAPSLSPDTQRRPQCIVLVGEAGIGKTRLAEELSHEAQKRGWAVAWSRVYAQESTVPYRQWTEVLRSAMTHGLWQRQEVSKQLLVYQPLSTLLPELHDLLPQVVFPSPLSPEREQLRLWEATLELLTTISERTPLLMVLDDFHWADASSGELFAYLVRRLHGRPIVIIGTYRDNELPAHNPLRSLLTDLQREQVIMHLSIQPLTDEQIGSLVAYLPSTVAQYIQAKAAGNPFFAEELARSIGDQFTTPNVSISIDQDTTYPLPDTITAVLELRMGRLSSACQRLLSNAAVLGGSFTFHVIHQMEAIGSSSVNEDDLLDLIEEAIQAGVLMEEGTGTRITYHFWHPLLVSHLYDQLSAARRARLHRRAADVLQLVYQGREEEGAAIISNHLVEGGAEPLRIVHYAEIAADHAYSLSAYPEAARYYRIAVAHLDEHMGTSLTSSQEERMHLAYLLERQGESTRIQGNYEEARHLYERVLEVRSQQRTFTSHDEYQYKAQIDALLWREVALTWYDTGDSLRAQQYCERGEQVLREAGVVGGSAWAILRLQQGYIYWQEGNYNKAQLVADEALKLFNEVLQHQMHPERSVSRLTGTIRTLGGDPIVLGRTHLLLGLVANSVGRHTEALTQLNTALTIFEQHHRERDIAHVCCDLGDIHLKKAEHELAYATLRRSRSLAEQFGDVPLLSVVFYNLGELAVRTGDLIEAEAWFRHSISLAEQINDQVYVSLWNVGLATVLQHQGKLSEARTCVYRILTIGRVMNNAPCIGIGLVVLGNLRIAQAMETSKGKTIAEKDTRMFQKVKHNRNDTRTRFLLRAKTILEHALALEELEAETKIEGQMALANALLLLDELETAQHYAIRTLKEAQEYGLVWGFTRCQRLLGRIMAEQGQQEQAEQYFEQSVQLFRKYDMRLEYARTLESYGLVLLQHKNAGEDKYKQGLSYLREAQQIFNECHAALDLQKVESVLPAYTHHAK